LSVFSFAFLISEINFVDAQKTTQRGRLDNNGNFIADDLGNVYKKVSGHRGLNNHHASKQYLWLQEVQIRQDYRSMREALGIPYI
ncbi:MAG: hypothetical protein ACO219_03865, partial [Holophagaceae bacterium]